MIAGMRMGQITKDEVEKLQFPGSGSNGNNALRTLRRMYSKAKEDKLLFEVPDFGLFKEHGQSLRLNDEAERRLSAVAEPFLKSSTRSPPSSPHGSNSCVPPNGSERNNNFVHQLDFDTHPSSR
jgi:hypothetical protein